MRKVIKGKMYDTSTAKLAGSWDNGLLPGDLGYMAESLYRKRTGEYFLHGRGGAQTPYARAAGGGFWGSGENISAMTEPEARAWAEAHLGAEEYEAAFAVPDEGGMVRVDAATLAALRSEAARTGESMGAVVARLAGSIDGR